MIRGIIRYGSKLNVLVLIITGGTFLVCLPCELLLLLNVQRLSSVVTAVCRTLLLEVMLFLVGILDLIIYDRIWFPFNIVLGNMVNTTLRVCRGFRQCITFIPVYVVVSVDNMVVFGHCVELAIKLIILCEHPLLVRDGR